MTYVKIAISIERPLFEQAEKLAQEMNLSRSRLYALALERLVEQQRNQQMLEQLNRVYGGTPPTDEETRVLEAVRRQQRRLMEDEG